MAAPCADWLTSRPEGGKANAATIKLLARLCGVAAGALTLVGGATRRRKVIDIHGQAEP